MQTNCIFIASTFVIHSQISIFSVFKIASFTLYWLQIKFSMSLFFYLFTFANNMWHRKFVTAVFVNNQHGIQQWEQDFDKKHMNTLRIHSYTRREIKIGALKMQFVCIFFHVCWIYAEN